MNRHRTTQRTERELFAPGESEQQFHCWATFLATLGIAAIAEIPQSAFRIPQFFGGRCPGTPKSYTTKSRNQAAPPEKCRMQSAEQERRVEKSGQEIEAEKLKTEKWRELK
jgi:hypothetical protein